MARRRRTPIVPEAKPNMGHFQAQVMRDEGFKVNPDEPEAVKYEVARSLGIDLKPGYNGKLSTEQAGKVGGRIGGTMVREMIRLAQQKLAQQERERV